MTGWVKIAEEWFEQESTEALPADVVLVHLSALAYSARHSTNGRVPAKAVHRLWPATDPQAAIQLLVTSGFWSPLSTGDWQVRDWETFILSALEVEKRRANSRETSERHRRHKLGDHSMCDRCEAVRRGRDTSRDTSGDTSGEGSVTSSVTALRTDPNRSDPKGRRRGETAATTAAGAASPASSEAINPPPGLAPHTYDRDVCCNLPPNHPVHQQLANAEKR